MEGFDAGSVIEQGTQDVGCVARGPGGGSSAGAPQVGDDGGPGEREGALEVTTAKCWGREVHKARAVCVPGLEVGRG